MKCRPIGTDGTIKGSPVSFHAPQHQNFTSTSPLAALSANINYLRTDLCLLVREGIVVVEGFLRPMVICSGMAMARYITGDSDNNMQQGLWAEDMLRHVS